VLAGSCCQLFHFFFLTLDASFAFSSYAILSFFFGTFTISQQQNTAQKACTPNMNFILFFYSQAEAACGNVAL